MGVAGIIARGGENARTRPCKFLQRRGISPCFDVFKPSRTRLSARLTAQATPSSTGTPALRSRSWARSVMPAQPSTIASAPSSASARSFQFARPSPEPAFEREHRNLGRADPRAQSDQPIFLKVVLDRNDRTRNVVTTLNFAAMRLAMWNAASPMPMTGAAWRTAPPRARRRRNSDDEGVRVARLRSSRSGPARRTPRRNNPQCWPAHGRD